MREARSYLAKQREQLGAIHPLNTVGHSNELRAQIDHRRKLNRLLAMRLNPRCCEWSTNLRALFGVEPRHPIRHWQLKARGMGAHLGLT